MANKHNHELRKEGRAAVEKGLKRFVPSVDNRCKLHGSETNAHYSASGRCCECDRLQKKPAQQAEYWASIKTEMSIKRKAEYAAKKCK